MKVDLGCGQNLPEGEEWVGVDRVEDSDADIMRDLEQNPNLPFEDSSVEVVRARHILEHLSSDSLKELFKEVSRVLKPEGVFLIVVPHFLSWNSATFDHEQLIGRNSFDIITEDHGFVNQWCSDFELTDKKYVMEDDLKLVRHMSRVFSDQFMATYIPNSVREVWFKLETA